MPEYLAPGVYVEETSFRSKSIEGVGTSTTAFVGATSYGPIGGSPELLTSYADYERIYGGIDNLVFGSGLARHNYLAHAVRAYFNNGGARLYVVRVYNGTGGLADSKSTPIVEDAGKTKFGYFLARFPGAYLNGATVQVQLVATPVSGAAVQRLTDGATLRVTLAGANPGDPVTYAIWFRQNGTYQRLKSDGTTEDVPAADQSAVTKIETLSLNISVTVGTEVRAQYSGVSPNSASINYIGKLLPHTPTSRAAALSQPLEFVLDAGAPADPASLLSGLVGAPASIAPGAGGVEASATFTLGAGSGSAIGSDGSEPQASNYETDANGIAGGFDLLLATEDVSIVAAPGYSSYAGAAGIQAAMITHVEHPRMYRIGVLDSPAGKTPTEMRDLRGSIDSTRAALYYPWVTVANPLAGPNSDEPVELLLPPSGFVCGIFARSDVNRGVWKAPANEIVQDALRFERDVNFAEQELLNPLGVNCLRYLSGRGYRVWGARTVSSDPEWIYVNVRRYFNYLEASIDRGTQWAVFEPNGEQLWANVRGTIGDFLYSEWKSGALLGSKPEQAYFVRCDRTTMTQNDLDNGRMVCLIGVAVVKPAEFVIFRIGQKTVDAG